MSPKLDLRRRLAWISSRKWWVRTAEQCATAAVGVAALDTQHWGVSSSRTVRDTAAMVAITFVKCLLATQRGDPTSSLITK